MINQYVADAGLYAALVDVWGVNPEAYPGLRGSEAHALRHKRCADCGAHLRWHDRVTWTKTAETICYGCAAIRMAAE